MGLLCESNSRLNFEGITKHCFMSSYNYEAQAKAWIFQEDSVKPETEKKTLRLNPRNSVSKMLNVRVI